jgi:hypothetical protein
VSFVSSLDLGVPELCHGDTGGEFASLVGDSRRVVNGSYGIFLIFGNEVITPLTPRRRIISEKLLKKFPTFYGTRRFTIVF